MNILDRFGVEEIKKEDNQVIFLMEDTFYFERWLLDFEVGYVMRHFVDGSLDQIIISLQDYEKMSGEIKCIMQRIPLSVKQSETYIQSKMEIDSLMEKISGKSINA